MEQNGNSLQGESLQAFLDSCNNPKLGPRQFFTPPLLAEALATVLPAFRPTALDLQVGSGELLLATGAEHSFGLDLDTRITKPDGATGEWHLTNADTTRWYPLANEVKLKTHLITINPPFSLQWHTDRLQCLEKSRDWETRTTFTAHTDSGNNSFIDSTLASYLIALDLLTPDGEGFMVCNADTARRLFGDPRKENSQDGAQRHIWLWLDIPDTIYQNQHTRFDTAVIYFARSHNEDKPHHLTAPSSDPDSIRTLLNPVAQKRMVYRKGLSLDSGSSMTKADNTESTWNAVTEELERRSSNAPPSHYNISLHPNGTIRRNLTTFQVHSGKYSYELIGKLNALAGQTPLNLVVQQATRKALREAIDCGLWTVDPKLLEAVNEAEADYNRIRAPFFRPTQVQALGSIDEISTITCISNGLPGLKAGENYPIETRISATTWETTKPNLAGGDDRVTYTGRELVITIPGDEYSHSFHYRRDEKAPGIVKGHRHEHHHHNLPVIFDYFDVPIPRDVADLNPDLYQNLHATLKTFEEHVNHNTLPQPPRATDTGHVLTRCGTRPLFTQEELPHIRQRLTEGHALPFPPGDCPSSIVQGILKNHQPFPNPASEAYHFARQVLTLKTEPELQRFQEHTAVPHYYRIFQNLVHNS